MSLGISLQAALSGLRVNQEAMRVLTNNIANASVQGYSRQKAALTTQIINGVPVGAKIEDIARQADDFLIEQIRAQASDFTKSRTVRDYYDRIQFLYGQPDSQNSLSSVINNFFTSLDTLATSPEQSYNRVNAVDRIRDMASRVSGVARNLLQIRFDADQQVSSTVNTLNNTLDNLKTVNNSIKEAIRLGQPTSALLDRRDELVRKISETIDTRANYQNDGTVHISTGDGIQLLDINSYRIQYTPAAGTDVFKLDQTLSEIKVTLLDSAGQLTTSSQTLVSSGISGSTVTHRIAGGSLKGLLDIRDADIPRLQQQVDRLADNMRNEMNKLHNNGTGFPPASSLTGTRLMSPTEQRNYSGFARIAVVGPNGRPVAAPYANVANNKTDESLLRPLKLNLGALDAGGGAGKPDLNTIIKEINTHFGPPQNKAVAGKLADIRLGAVSNSFGPPFTFDFELDNAASANCNFRVTGMTCTDPGVTFGAIPPGLSTAPGLATTAGEVVRTSPTNQLTANFSGGTTGPVYTVTVNVEVDGVAGTVQYQIDTSKTNIRNDRFYTTNATGVAQKVVPSSNQAFAVAELVDANGNVVGAGQSGYLRVRTLNGTYGISFDEMDSKEGGVVGQESTTKTDRGFSHFFELNNLFVSNTPISSTDPVRNSALNFAVRADILTRPASLTTGRITRSPQNSDPTKPPLYTYEVNSGNTSALRDMVSFRTTRISFATAGTLPTTISTLGGYGAELTSFTSLKTAESTRLFEQSRLLNEGLVAKNDSISGVNVDEELANMVQLQNNYAAAAKVIASISAMFDKLLEIRT